MKIEKVIQEWIDDQTQGKRDAEYLGKQAGLTGSLIRQILRGEKKASPKTLITLAPVLGIPAVRLLVDAGYLREDDIQAITKESQIPPELAEALKVPEMRRLYGKLWKLREDDPPFDIHAMCDRVLSLSPDQMAAIEVILRNMNPKPSGM